MRFYQYVFSLLIGGLALWITFKPVKEVSFFTDWLYAAPFWVLVAITILYLFIDLRQYRSSKRIRSFLPFLLCLLILSVILWRQNRIETLDRSPTKFTATTFDIGNDGGFLLDFKMNGHLKAEKRDHWLVTFYWGRYSQHKDTLDIDLPLNFQLPKRALLNNDTLHFLGDTSKFFVIRQ